MGKGGRPRKVKAKRTPSGQISRARSCEFPMQERQDNGPTPEIAARRTLAFGSPTGFGDLAWPIDLMRRELSREQYEAAQRFQVVRDRFEASWELPGLSQPKMEHVDGSKARTPMPERAVETARDDWEEAGRAVRAYSVRAWLALLHVIAYRRAPRSIIERGLVRDALDVLAAHWAGHRQAA